MSCHSWPTHQCYFCKKNPWKKFMLADGCYVPICTVCYPMMEKLKNIAKERGLYDASKITRNIGRGGDKMKIEKGNTGGNNLKVEFIQERKITSIKIIDEGAMITYEPKKDGDKAVTRLVIGVSYEGQGNGDPEKWSLNNKSRNALINVWGDDTEKWIGKIAEILISGDGDYKHIMIDTLRTK